MECRTVNIAQANVVQKNCTGEFCTEKVVVQEHVVQENAVNEIVYRKCCTGDVVQEILYRKYCTGKVCTEKAVHEQMKSITEKYGSAFFLEQRLHPFNTQTNETFNQSQSCLTSKNKVFHSRKAFYYHHAIMVGMHNWGYKRYWQEVFNTTGVHYTTQLVNHLDRVTKVKAINK